MLKKLFKIIYYLFFVFISAIAILLVVSVFPITGNFKVLIVQSGSMEPKIMTGAIVLVKPASDYKIGDIVTFLPPGGGKKTITHRIAEIKNKYNKFSYVTKGDANNSIDQNEIEQKNIIGKVLVNIPYVGYAVDVAKKPYGFAALIILPALLIIFDEIKKILNEVKNIRQKKKSPEEKNTE